MFSKRQLYTIKTFGKEPCKQFTLHSGPFGCGKTYSIMIAFGVYCLELKRLGIKGLTFVLLGKTQQSVKKNMCNVLSKLYGEDFKYDASLKSGTVKDATLFDQNIYIIGLNDTSSESKFRGISDIMGIVHDEAVLCTKEQFEYIIGRLRGEKYNNFPDNYLQHWYVGSTNPDVPNHFILQYVKDGVIDMVHWYMRDACWDGADEYYNRLRLLYKDNKAFYNRYLLGKWTSADRMVYVMFNPKQHVYDSDGVELDYKQMKRHIIAVDYGGDHPTAILCIHLNHQGVYIVDHEYKFQNTAPSKICEHIGRVIDFTLYLGGTVPSVSVDPSAKALKDELTSRGIEYTNALNSHIDGIGCVQNLLSLNKIIISDECKNLINEMYSYRYKDNSNGKDEVIKLGDDFVDSLRYGVYTDSMLGGRNVQ